MKKLIHLLLITIVLNSCTHSEQFSTCDQEMYKGKLSVKGICMNYVIEVIKGDIDLNLVEQQWTHPETAVVYNNAFALGSVCDFPSELEQGDEFYFSISSNAGSNCAVCAAYSPTPSKSLVIKVCRTNL